ncbi:hypothetical protein MMPV_007395 [Pyropia vietnamensis]
MTLCPYKWALYIGSMMALLWCALVLWMEWQSPTDPTDEKTIDGSWEERARAKGAALADDDTDGTDSDSEDEANASLVAAR